MPDQRRDLSRFCDDGSFEKQARIVGRLGHVAQPACGCILKVEERLGWNVEVLENLDELAVEVHWEWLERSSTDLQFPGTLGLELLHVRS